MIYNYEKVNLAFILGTKWEENLNEATDEHKALHGLFALCNASYPNKVGEEPATITKAKAMRLLQGMNAEDIISTLQGMGHIDVDEKGKITIKSTPWC